MNRHQGRRGPSRGGPSGSSAPQSRGSAAPLKPSTELPPFETFAEMPLRAEVLAAIHAMGITKPTPIQRLAIPPVMSGRDVIAKAETGTGKTLAFGAPMMSKIDASRRSVLGLVLCPTRELAQQVAQVLEKLGEPIGAKVALIVGGEPMNPQIDALKAGAQVVVGTPGRVIDLYGQKFLSFPWTEFVALDEADQMLEIGFIDDVRKILSYTPDERQTMLFSATFPDEVLRLAREATRDPMEVATAAGHATVKTIDQSWMACGRSDRSLALMRLIEQSSADDVFLVFCDRRTEVDALMRQLERMPFSVKALHGGFDQASRFRVMSAFRTGEVKALVATDVASRGLDVHLVTHVVNYSVPQDAQDYTHRIGRTGRAGRTGTAITLVSPEQEGRWHDILRQTKWNVTEAPLPGRSGRGRPAPRADHAEPAPRAPREERRDERPREEGRRREEPRRERRDEGRRESVRRDEVRRDEPRREEPRREEPRREEPRREEPRRTEARREAPRRDDTRRDDTRRHEPRRDERRPAAPQPARRPAPPPSVPQAPPSDRPKRAMSTRERLRLEREGRLPSDD